MPSMKQTKTKESRKINDRERKWKGVKKCSATGHDVLGACSFVVIVIDC
jgi:hypothetical protein